MDRFRGTLDELKALVQMTGATGEWVEHPNNHYQFRADDGAVLNWWDTKKKTVTIQGPDDVKASFKAALDAAFAKTFGDVIPPPVKGAKSKQPQIFVVHGHDHTSREQLERILLILGLEPFVLQNTAGQGLTIIEALERQIGKSPEAEFGIVLMTPDDMGFAKKDGPEKAEPRARQNVVMEMGMLLSSLTRERVAILVKGHVELPSDAQGIIYLHFNDHVREIVPKLTERLRHAGFDLDPAKVSRASS